MRQGGAGATDRGVAAVAGSGAEKPGKPKEDRLSPINKVNAVTVKIPGWRGAAFTFG